jgi:hypothetical protein
VAFLVAVAEMGFRLAQNVDAPYFALTVVGPVAMAIEIWRSSRAGGGAAFGESLRERLGDRLDSKGQRANA